MSAEAAVKYEQIYFNDIYQCYYSSVYRIALRITRDPHLSEDIAQETFLKAFLKMDTLFEKEKLMNWLSAIARRTAIDLFIRKKRNEVSIEDDYLTLADQGERIEDRIDYSLLKEKTQYVINTLKSDYREIMILKLFLEMKDHEIADFLSLNTSTVKTKIHRARKQIKAAF